jgi:type 1 glutamine amidotransferase
MDNRLPSVKCVENVRIKALFSLVFIAFFTCVLSCHDTGPGTGNEPEKKLNALIFSKTSAFRHEAIEPGTVALKEYFLENNIESTHTEDASLISTDRLKEVDVLIFLLTSGNVLDSMQEDAVMKFIGSGKGFVGIHSAADTEYSWPWYGDLVGARFANHPEIQQATFVRMDTNDMVRHLPERWARTDEIYNFVERPLNVNVVLSVDESTYTGGAHGDDHPISWSREYFGGRSFYTAMGHTVESYQDTLFLKHVAEGVKWAGRFD